MRNYIRYFLVIFSLLGGNATHAQSNAALVLSSQGEVTLQRATNTSIEAFSRVFAGDVIKLGKNATLSIIFARTGRQENWNGPGSIAISQSDESQVQAGNPSLEVRLLPIKVAQLISKTPMLDTPSKVGMVRMRAMPKQEDQETAEQDYRQLREASPTDDHIPEIFLLASLYAAGDRTKLDETLARLEQQYPADTTISRLIQIYRHTEISR